MLIVTSQNHKFSVVVGVGSEVYIHYQKEYPWAVYVNDAEIGVFDSLERAKGVMLEIQKNLICAALLLSGDGYELNNEKDREWAVAYMSYQTPSK